MYGSNGSNGSRLTKKSQGFKILKHVFLKGSATKYECLTKALRVKGSKKDLRGYYSVYFQDFRRNGILDYNYKTFQYGLTLQGMQVLYNAIKRK